MISSSVRAERGEEKKKRESRPCVSVYASEAPHMSPVNRRSLSLGRRTAPSRLTVPHARRPGAHGGSKGHITREYKQNLTTEEPPSPLTPPLLLPDVVTMPPFPLFSFSLSFPADNVHHADLLYIRSSVPLSQSRLLYIEYRYTGAAVLHSVYQPQCRERGNWGCSLIDPTSHC